MAKRGNKLLNGYGNSQYMIDRLAETGLSRVRERGGWIMRDSITQPIGLTRLNFR